MPLAFVFAQCRGPRSDLRWCVVPSPEFALDLGPARRNIYADHKRMTPAAGVLSDSDRPVSSDPQPCMLRRHPPTAACEDRVSGIKPNQCVRTPGRFRVVRSLQDQTARIVGDREAAQSKEYRSVYGAKISRRDRPSGDIRIGLGPGAH